MQLVCIRTLQALPLGITASCRFVTGREFRLLRFSPQLAGTPPIWLSFLAGQLNSISGENAGRIDQYFCRDGGSHPRRVEVALLLAGLWVVPVGVFIGLRPKLSAIAQPIAQVAASVPATALFPIVLLLLIRAGGGLGIGSIVLLLLGTQWYILFNVIAGATAIPSDLKEVCQTYRLSRGDRWRRLFLPAIFPYLITGSVTASGGAWNASIVAEYFHFRGETISTVGLGAIISRATDAGDFPMLVAATVVLAVMVVVINRLVWRRLDALGSSRFTLEA